MSAIRRVAVAGAGVAGLSAGALLARSGIEVDVYERREEIDALGSGITLQGNALRALDAIGVWDEVRRRGFPFEGLTLRAPGPDAPVVAELPEARTGGEDYPAGMGIFRPELSAILLEHAVSCGARVHRGRRVTDVVEREGGVEVFGGGEALGSYDLLIGADGLNSRVRSAIGIPDAPESTGMGIWRAVVPRPEEVTHTELYYGGPIYIAGYTPTGQDSMYAFLVEAAQDRSGLDGREAARIMRDEAQAYGGPWGEVRKALADSVEANYTWFTAHLIRGPWHRGRTVVIGDAAHSCPPTIAQGAAQGLEDAVVLCEMLEAADTVDDALLDAFRRRRAPRAGAVVEASVQLGQWQIDGDQDADVAGLMAGIADRMVEPA